MREHVAHVDCPCCSTVLEHHGDRPRLPEALEFHVATKHPQVAAAPAVRRRIVAAAWSDLRVAVWNAIAARPPRTWQHR